MAEPKTVSISIERLALIFGMIVQVIIGVWIVAVMHSSVSYNKEELKEINGKLNNELNDTKVRLRAAEKEISIMRSIFELEMTRRKTQ